MDINVDEAFCNLVREIRKYKKVRNDISSHVFWGDLQCLLNTGTAEWPTWDASLGQRTPWL
jgi:hypothetical protein